MLKAGKLNHSHIVAAGLQFKSAQTVGEVLRQSVLEDSVFEDGLMEIVFHLTEELMLAAGNAEYDLGSSFYRIYEGVVGGGVAGVKGHHHIGAVVGIVGDIAHEKFELIIPEACCHIAAKAYNIFL